MTRTAYVEWMARRIAQAGGWTYLVAPKPSRQTTNWG